jgi:hypothetical protein
MDASGDSPRDQALVSNWVGIAKMPKAIFGWPSWEISSSNRKTDGANESDQMVLTALLADQNGAGLEGVELRIVVWRNRSMEDVTALLQIENDGWIPIARLDSWPYSPHTNRHWKQLKQMPTVEGSHVHHCWDNAKLGRKAFGPYQNLPSAVPVDSEPNSFRDMLKLVEVHFNIVGASKLPAPEWQERLL